MARAGLSWLSGLRSQNTTLDFMGAVRAYIIINRLGCVWANLKLRGLLMLAYVPRERYTMRPYFYNGPQAARRNREEWKLSRDYGVIYDLSNDSSRPATAEEYERENNPETKRLKIVPDEFPELVKVETGKWR